MKRLLVVAPLHALAFAAALALALPAGAGELQLRVGGFFPTGGGEFWRETRDAFTLEKSDFFDGTAGASYLHPLGDYMDLVFDASVYSSDVVSATRGFTDEFGFPVEHDTELTIAPLTVGFRVVPGGREVEVGRHGHRLRPMAYLGAGVGTAYWAYEEEGDFVTQNRAGDDVIVFDRFREDGLTLAGHVMAGFELPLADQWTFLVEGRYLWAGAEPEDEFRDFEEIDLSGATIAAGVGFHF